MSSGIHETAAAGWRTRGAEDYERGRPGYPDAAVRLIGSELGVGPGTTILDLAAGTGKLTRELGVLGARVIAVEPLAAMRTQLAAAVDGVEVLDGRAEAIPLPDGSVRAVTVAQAFHWFDVPVASTEIARVLEPAGGLAILRNEWRGETAWESALGAVIDRFTRVPDAHGRDWSAELDATRRFETFAERSFENPQRVDLDGQLRQIASMSFVAALPDAERDALLDEAAEVLRAHGLADDETITIGTRTRVRWARARR